MYKSITRRPCISVYWGRSMQGQIGSGGKRARGMQILHLQPYGGKGDSASRPQDQGQCWFHPPGPLQGRLHIHWGHPHHCSVTQSCPALCNSMDCSPLGPSVHGESPGKDTGVGCHFLLHHISWVACIGRRFFTTVPLRKPKGWSNCKLSDIISDDVKVV